MINDPPTWTKLFPKFKTGDKVRYRTLYTKPGKNGKRIFKWNYGIVAKRRDTALSYSYTIIVQREDGFKIMIPYFINIHQEDLREWIPRS